MISRADAVTLVTKEDGNAVTLAEQMIDAAIIAAGGGRILVDLASLKKFNKRCRQRITQMYEQGGWTVTWHDGDQRDPGPHVELGWNS